MQVRINPINIMVMLVFAVMVIGAVTDDAVESTAVVTQSVAAPVVVPGSGGQQIQPTAVPPDDPPVIPPYDDYFITQGHHGFSYGHMAIDLSGGKGSTILAPISGIVSQSYIDEWGNPTLVIGNVRYEAMLLHGDYTVEVGDTVRQGQPIGTEANHGYTTDMNGNRCGNGRDCGYHTHLNIYDRQLGSNVDPFLWIAYIER